MTDYPTSARIDRTWLDRALYPESEIVRPRFSDLDPLNHVNNVAMAAMFETARVHFNYPMRAHFHTDSVRTLIVGQTLNYVAECHLRPELTFHLGVGHMGRSSWTIQTVAYQGETAVMMGACTLVTSKDGAACAVPEGLRAMLAERRLRLPE